MPTIQVQHTFIVWQFLFILAVTYHAFSYLFLLSLDSPAGQDGEVRPEIQGMSGMRIKFQ